MTFDSSNRDRIERMSNDNINSEVRIAMGEGCIKPCGVFDLVDETLDRMLKYAEEIRKRDEVLRRVHDYLGELIRDSLVSDTPRASDLADDVFDVMGKTDRPKRNCEIYHDFNSAYEAFVRQSKKAVTCYADDAEAFGKWCFDFTDGKGHEVVKCNGAYYSNFEFAKEAFNKAHPEYNSPNHTSDEYYEALGKWIYSHNGMED